MAITIWSWGLGTSGRLGDGTAVTKSSPTQIGVLSTWSSVAAGEDHVLAVKANGSLWSWGRNTAGQLGDGTVVDKSSPVQVGILTDWLRVAAGKTSGGNNHSLAVKTGNTLWTWGTNGSGELGDGTIVAKSSPIQIGILTNWAKVSAGASYSMAIKTDGTLWSWGTNGSGNLGDGTVVQKSSPAQVGTLTNWASVSASGANVLAVKTDGTLWSWGLGASGRLGSSATADRSSPVQVGTLTNWASVSAGGAHGLAVKTDGTLWAWGLGTSGQLGDGTIVSKSSPVQVGLLTTWASVAAGDLFSLAIKTDGTLWAWGAGTSGALGDGTAVTKSSPVQVGLLTTWLQATDGTSFSAAVQTFVPASLTADLGTFTLTGVAAGLRADRRLTAAVGTFSLTGVAAGLRAAHTITAVKGTFTFTGVAARLARLYTLTAAQGTFTLTGIAAGLRAAHTVTAAKGTFTLTGIAAGLRRGYTLAAAKGTFTLTGIADVLRHSNRMQALKGTFAITGNPAILTHPYRLPAGRGIFAVNTGDTGLIIRGLKGYTPHFRDRTSSTSGEEPVYLVEITHPQLADPVRVVNDTKDLQRGFIGYEVTVPTHLVTTPSTLDFDFTKASISDLVGSTVLTVARAGSTATRVNSAGFIQGVAADTPRLDFDPVSLTCRGLLVEETRQNVLTRSNNFAHADWIKLLGATVRSGTTLAPDGTIGMDTIDFSLTASNRIEQTPSVAAVNGETWTFSIWLSGSGTININVGTFTGVGGQSEPTITLTEVPTRYSATVTYASPTGNVRAMVIKRIPANSATSCNVWGSVLEKGPSPSSYIPTTSAAATRNADVPTVSDISGFYNADQGTLLVDWDFDVIGTAAGIVAFDDGTNTQCIRLRQGVATPTSLVAEVSNGSPQVQLAFTSMVVNTQYRAAFAYKLNSFAGSRNGETVITDPTGTIPTVNTMHLGAGASLNPLNGHIRRFTYYPVRLPDANLQDLARTQFAASAVPVTLEMDFTEGTTAPQVGSAMLTCGRTGASTRINSFGKIEVVLDNTPRIDYDPVTLACQGVLNEETRTNLLLRSAEIDNAAWFKTALTVAANTADTLAPDGLNTAEKLTTAGTGSVFFSQSANGVVIGDKVTWSIRAKKGTTDKIIFELHASAWSDGGNGPTFNLTNGTKTSGIATDTIKPIGNGWYVCSATRTASVNNAGNAFFVDGYGSAVSGRTLYVWGAQAEVGSTSTSYIPTTTAAVTRTADQLAITSFGSWFNPNTSTVYMEFTPGSKTSYAAFEFNAGSINDSYGVYRSSARSKIAAYAYSDTLLEADFDSSGDVAPYATAKVAAAFKSNDLGISLNGGVVGTDTVSFLEPANQLDIGWSANPAFNNYHMNGHIKRFVYFPVRLANADLQELTLNSFEIVPVATETYIACAFRVQFPDDVAQVQPRVPLSIDNIGRELTQWLEFSNGGRDASVRIMQVMRDTPDIIEQEFTLDLLDSQQTAVEVSANLGYSNVLDAPALVATQNTELQPNIF